MVIVTGVKFGIKDQKFAIILLGNTQIRTYFGLKWEMQNNVKFEKLSKIKGI